MVKKKNEKQDQTGCLRSSCEVTIQKYFISTNCTVLPSVSGRFSQFLFNLNEMTMNLLVVVKINSMTFTERNLYTYKDSISFSKQLYILKLYTFQKWTISFASGIRISNYTQTHHKIHETLACGQRKLNQNTILGALAINRAAFNYKVESKRSTLEPKEKLRITWSFRFLLDLFQQSQLWNSRSLN